MALVNPASARREGARVGVRAAQRRSRALLKALIDGGAGIETLAIERPGFTTPSSPLPVTRPPPRWARWRKWHDAPPLGFRHRPPRFHGHGAV